MKPSISNTGQGIRGIEMYHGKNEVTAIKVENFSLPDNYSIERIEGRIPFAKDYLPWAILTRRPDDPVRRKLAAQIEQYNRVVDAINTTPDFLPFFISNGLMLTRDQIQGRWSDDFADLLFSLENYLFDQRLYANAQWFFSSDCSPKYSFVVQGDIIHFEIKNSVIHYSYPSTSRYSYIWNPTDDERDMTFWLWCELDHKKLLPDRECEEDAFDRYVDYECYEQGKDSMVYPDPRLVKCLDLLEKFGYLKTYSIHPADEHPCWTIGMKSDYSVDLALFDKKAFTDSLMKEKIRLITACSLGQLESPIYFLTNSKDQRYISNAPGQFGGHNKLKIYGRLDCHYAIRHVAGGKYIKYRVFFEDEETAIAAGYRPCSVCMKEAYREWKYESNLTEKTE